MEQEVPTGSEGNRGAPEWNVKEHSLQRAVAVDDQLEQGRHLKRLKASGSAPLLAGPGEEWKPVTYEFRHGGSLLARPKASPRKLQTRRRRRFAQAGILALLLTLAHGSWADGIPEPSLVLYGVITDPSAGGYRVSYGTITWTFQPVAGGSPVVVSGPVTNINDQFSYVLRIPCETQIAGQNVSTGALMLAASPVTYNCSQVTILGVAATFTVPAQTNLTLQPTDRGRIQEIDLMASLNGTGLLPPAWQFQYFGHLGVDPFADPDGDGLNNYEEYIAGTNPLDPQSRFQILKVRPNPGGPFVDWSSVAGKFYTVQRSTSLLGGFADLQTHIAATAPLNTYEDVSGSAGGPYFYRVRVEF